jgi:hypothetical protein
MLAFGPRRRTAGGEQLNKRAHGQAGEQAGRRAGRQPTWLNKQCAGQGHAHAPATAKRLGGAMLRRTAERVGTGQEGGTIRVSDAQQAL